MLTYQASGTSTAPFKNAALNCSSGIIACGNDEIVYAAVANPSIPGNFYLAGQSANQAFVAESDVNGNVKYTVAGTGIGLANQNSYVDALAITHDSNGKQHVAAAVDVGSNAFPFGSAPSLPSGTQKGFIVDLIDPASGSTLQPSGIYYPQVGSQSGSQVAVVTTLVPGTYPILCGGNMSSGAAALFQAYYVAEPTQSASTVQLDDNMWNGIDTFQLYKDDSKTVNAGASGAEPTFVTALAYDSNPSPDYFFVALFDNTNSQAVLIQYAVAGPPTQQALIKVAGANPLVTGLAIGPALNVSGSTYGVAFERLVATGTLLSSNQPQVWGYVYGASNKLVADANWAPPASGYSSSTSYYQTAVSPLVTPVGLAFGINGYEGSGASSSLPSSLVLTYF